MWSTSPHHSWMTMTPGPSPGLGQRQVALAGVAVARQSSPSRPRAGPPRTSGRARLGGGATVTLPRPRAATPGGSLLPAGRAGRGGGRAVLGRRRRGRAAVQPVRRAAGVPRPAEQPRGRPPRRSWGRGSGRGRRCRPSARPRPGSAAWSGRRRARQMRRVGGQERTRRKHGFTAFGGHRPRSGSFSAPNESVSSSHVDGRRGGRRLRKRSRGNVGCGRLGRREMRGYGTATRQALAPCRNRGPMPIRRTG